MSNIESVLEIAKCLTCDAWDGGEAKSGKCRLNPPATHVVLVPMRTVQGDGLSAQIVTAWPETTESDFCFEHFSVEKDEISDEVKIEH